MSRALAVYKMNDYEWYITPWNLEDTLKWYNEEFEDDLTKEDIEEANLDTEGMWWETTDKKDLDELGDSDEIIGIEKTIKGTRRKVRFGNLMRKEGLKEPEVIASTDW